ncbi:MAG: ABC transporter ATP-binding protein [Caldisericia bacterium]|nr:ABC transporter ATP-binding protein [Caldisericia bacterium]
MPLLEVKNLHTYFYTMDGLTKSVEGVNFSIEKGETLGLVGESGCGKSVTSLSIMQLVARPPGKIEQGQIIFKGEDLLKKNSEEMRKIRGEQISMIFQEPMTSLNPVFTVGNQVAEVLINHYNISKVEAKQKVIDVFSLVGIPDPERRFSNYPHQMSGGMRQRVMIAMALACDPDLLIADEPTTALDVTIQAQILELMRDIKKRTNMSIILITHNLAVVAEMADKVAVMYYGRIVEYTTIKEIFSHPMHPYTYGLLHSIPRVDQPRTKEPLPAIRGVVPNPYIAPTGCKFHPRCNFAKDKCKSIEPDYVEISPTHAVRCWYPLEKQEQSYASRGA